MPSAAWPPQQEGLPETSRSAQVRSLFRSSPTVTQVLFMMNLLHNFLVPLMLEALRLDDLTGLSDLLPPHLDHIPTQSDFR